MQVRDDVREGLGKGCSVADQEVSPGVEAEAGLAVHRVFRLDHLLNLEAGAKRVLAEVEGKVVEVGAVEVALLPRGRAGTEASDANDGNCGDLAVRVRRPLIGQRAVDRGRSGELAAVDGREVGALRPDELEFIDDVGIDGPGEVADNVLAGRVHEGIDEAGIVGAGPEAFRVGDGHVVVDAARVEVDLVAEIVIDADDVVAEIILRRVREAVVSVGVVRRILVEDVGQIDLGVRAVAVGRNLRGVCSTS